MFLKESILAILLFWQDYLIKVISIKCNDEKTKNNNGGQNLSMLN